MKSIRLINEELSHLDTKKPGISLDCEEMLKLLIENIESARQQLDRTSTSNELINTNIIKAEKTAHHILNIFQTNAPIYVNIKPVDSHHDREMSQGTEKNLAIPRIPLKAPIDTNSDRELLKLIQEKETHNTKYILVECNICGTKPILMPIPKKLVEESELPIVDISYIHGETPHVIVAQLDHDYQVRRTRTSPAVFEHGGSAQLIKAFGHLIQKNRNG